MIKGVFFQPWTPTVFSSDTRTWVEVMKIYMASHTFYTFYFKKCQKTNILIAHRWAMYLASGFSNHQIVIK